MRSPCRCLPGGSGKPDPGGPALQRHHPMHRRPAFIFQDEFDGPAGSGPIPGKWIVAQARETIKNPVFWDRPENMGQYRDDRANVFLDGNSNLVIPRDAGTATKVRQR